MVCSSSSLARWIHFSRHYLLDDLPGVGKVTGERLEKLGIRTVKQLRGLDVSTVKNQVGGSNPPPRNQRHHRVTKQSCSFLQGQKGAIYGCFGGPFFILLPFSAGRSAICTTLLLAAPFP